MPYIEMTEAQTFRRIFGLEKTYVSERVGCKHKMIE